MKIIKGFLLFRQAVSNQAYHQRLGWWLTVILIVIYMVSFPIFLPILGETVSAFTCLPIMAAAWFLGPKRAFWISLVITIASFTLYRIFTPEVPLYRQIHLAVFGLIVLVVLSYFIGWASNLRFKLQRELAERKQMEKVIIESEQRYRMLFHDASDSIVIYDLEGKFLEMNQTAIRRLGYDMKSLPTLEMVTSSDADHVALIARRIAYVQKHGQNMFETFQTGKDGKVVPVEVNARLISYQGKPAILSLGRDITQRKAIERAEHEQRIFAEALRNIAADLTGTLQFEEVLDRILDNLSHVVNCDSATIMLVEGTTAYVTRHRGYMERGRLENIQDMHFAIETYTTLLTMAQTKKSLVIENVSSDPAWVILSNIDWISSYAGAPIHLKGNVIGFLNVESATPGCFNQEQASRLQAFADHAAIAIHNARLYEEVQKMALFDQLTGAYNRRGLMEIGQREVERSHRFGTPLAVLMMDIDHFKQFNEYYSYSVGDEVLTTFAKRCKSSVRKTDLVCRYGGDEFIILLTENTLDTACYVADLLRKAIEEQPFDTSRGLVNVTASFGVATSHGENCDLSTLIASAADALQQAKQQGRNQVIGL